jgi:hypothetical protein
MMYQHQHWQTPQEQAMGQFLGEARAQATTPEGREAYLMALEMAMNPMALIQAQMLGANQDSIGAVMRDIARRAAGRPGMVNGPGR